MSDEFDELAGPAGLNEEDAVGIAEVVEDDEIPEVDDVIDPLADPIDDGSMGGEEESDQAEIENLILDELYGDQN